MMLRIALHRLPPFRLFDDDLLAVPAVHSYQSYRSPISLFSAGAARHPSRGRVFARSGWLVVAGEGEPHTAESKHGGGWMPVYVDPSKPPGMLFVWQHGRQGSRTPASPNV